MCEASQDGSRQQQGPGIMQVCVSGLLILVCLLNSSFVHWALLNSRTVAAIDCKTGSSLYHLSVNQIICWFNPVRLLFSSNIYLPFVVVVSLFDF